MYFSFHGKIWKRSMCDCSLLHFIVHLHISELSFSQWICLFSHIKTLLLRLSLSLIFFFLVSFFFAAAGVCLGAPPPSLVAQDERKEETRGISAPGWTDEQMEDRTDERRVSATEKGKGWEHNERFKGESCLLCLFASDAALPRWRVSMVTRAWRLAGLPNRQTCCQCHQGC